VESEGITPPLLTLALDVEVEVEVTLRLTVSQYVEVSSPIWDLSTDITFCPRLLSESCCLVRLDGDERSASRPYRFIPEEITRGTQWIGS
jgi:hypothetical protein